MSRNPSPPMLIVERTHLLASLRHDIACQVFSHNDVPMAAEPSSSQLSTTPDGDRQTMRAKANLLFVGFDADDEGDLSAMYGTSETGLTFSKGGTEDLLLLGTGHFDAVAIQVDLCDLYSPVIVRFLHQRNSLAPDADVVAVTGYLIPSFVEQLKSSGCTSVINALKDFRLIFPRRVKPARPGSESA